MNGTVFFLGGASIGWTHLSGETVVDEEVDGVGGDAGDGTLDGGGGNLGAEALDGGTSAQEVGTETGNVGRSCEIQC